MKNLIFIFLLLVSIAVKAQVNLVPNPSFEDYSPCPDNEAQITRATGWYSPTNGSPDYFNACSPNPSYSTPTNLFGEQQPNLGNGYIGLGPYYSGSSNYREYIQSELSDTLIAGKTYCIQFFTSLAGKQSKYANNNIGLVLSELPITAIGNLGPLIDFPTSLNSNIIIDDSINWIQLSGIYIANGSEKYITIGNFYSNQNTDAILIDSTITADISYYYIDDVSVVQCDTILPLTIPNVFTPNNDGINEVFEIKYLPSNSQLTIYNRWGSKVYQSNNYQNNWNGENASDGVYYYILTLLSGNTTKGMVTILRN